MKKLFLFILFIFPIKFFSQNIKCEIADYLKKIDNKEYSTYQYINASYSYSRPLIVLITSKEIFMKIHQKIPKIFLSKQEYTDVFLLGIDGFNRNNIDETEKKIIDIFIKNIEKYRIDNNIIPISKESLLLQIKYLTKAEDLCEFFSCRK